MHLNSPNVSFWIIRRVCYSLSPIGGGLFFYVFVESFLRCPKKSSGALHRSSIFSTAALVETNFADIVFAFIENASASLFLLSLKSVAFQGSRVFPSSATGGGRMPSLQTLVFGSYDVFITASRQSVGGCFFIAITKKIYYNTSITKDEG